MRPGDTRYARWARSFESVTRATEELSPFLRFSREEWSRLRAAAPLTLTEEDLSSLRGLNEKVSLEEVVEVYLPLARLLNLHIGAARALYSVTDSFLGNPAAKVPYVVGIAGSVAVGKSTTARILETLLSRGPGRPQVALIATDGFLYPNRVLRDRGLMERKGFPESYDLRRLMRFMADVKAGYPEISAPVYSHLAYDIVPTEKEYVRQPEVLIVEGLNVLQGGNGQKNAPPLFVSDFFDFSVYVDADEAHVERWFSERFLALRDTVFKDESSYFHRYAHLSEGEARRVAARIWADINGVNLRENIAPTRERANLILKKGADHEVLGVRLRKL
jgi:type I pantothenate kinase